MYDLPNVPAEHQDFISYVQSHQDKPIEDLVRPYNEYDAVARKVFAQEPSHPALKDNCLNLVPLYDESTGSNNIQVRARNLYAEPQELRDQYLLPLKNKDRRPTGSPAVVPTLEEFQKNFTLFSEGALSDLDWSNVVVAGSAVVTSLLPVPEKHRGSKRALRQFYHEKFAPASDVDLFLYGLTDEEAVEKIKHIESRIKNTILYETTTVRTKNTITIVSQYPTRHVQIVLRIYKSVAEILTGFDVDCSCAAYDGKQVYASPRALASYITQINHIDMTRRSPSYENRLSKYSHRGFEVFWPSLDRSKIDPTIFERSFSRTVGLARLLVLEKLPKTEDRENYLMQRRAERGQPLANRYAQRMKQLPGNIKDDWDDEAPEWQEEDEISDYNHFSIPYGPRYHAKRIERLLFTKDLLLNAEWNRPKDRTVWLHRHPAFFGDAEDVIHDCCGYCPEPVTDEEKEVAEEESKIYISGDVSFIKDDPGRQEIGSFNPITDTDWTEMAYIGNTEQLCQAIVDHDLAAVKEWLSRDSSDPNTRDYTGRTPLHLASLTSTPDIVQCLVDNGARMISRVADGRTALHFAAARGNVDIIRVLLTKSEQNEEQEAKKGNLRKSEPAQGNEEKEKPTDQSEEDDDIDMVSNDDGSSRTSGSFVKVEASESGDVFDGAENELEPDIYDVNVLAWDSHTSPLHLAILNGHVDVVEELVSSFGADVLLPIKLLSSENTPTAAILTLVLALQLPLEKAKPMTQKLLQLGASPAQADLNHNTPLHYLAASKYSELLDLYHHHDEPAVKRAIDHLAFAGHSWNPEPYSAFTAAINAKNVIGAIKMLEAGAEPTLEFSHFVKSAKAVFDTIQSNSSEENQNIFRYNVAQPIILAVKKELPELVIDLLKRGVDPNPLTAEGCSVVDDEDVRDYKKGSSLLDYVREKIKSLQAYKGEECTSSPPRPLETDDKVYLEGIEEGTYAMLTARQQVKEARKEYEMALKNHEDSVNEARNCKGVDRKFAAAKDLVEEFQRVEAVLLEKGAKTFAELYPDIEAPKENEEEEEEEEEEDEPLKKDKFKVTYKFNVPDLTDTKRNGYLEMYNAAWNGDLATIKALTLATWGPDNEEAPLQIAVTDRHLFSPFSIAVLRGHLSVAKAILEIVQAQYKPKEQKGHKRYTADYDTDQPRIYSEIIDDQFTVDNIGEVATQVECPIKPLDILEWGCSAGLFIENYAMSESERYEVQSGIQSVLQDYFSTWRVGDEASRIPQHVVDYAVWTDNVPLLVFLLELGQEFTSQDMEKDSTIYTVPERVFVMAIGLGRLRCLEELIKRTGAGMPIDEFVQKSGVKMTERPDYYQGLTIRGKKRADWARAERQGRPEKSKSSPLLVAASYGNLDSTKWFLGKEPGQQYVAFTKTYEHDQRLKHLERSAKGVEGALMNWLRSRSGLSLHCAVLSKPNEEFERLVEYLAKQYPGGLETKSLEGHTPLALAFSLHRTSYAKILIEAGADQTTRDRSGNNLAHLLLCDKNGKARDKPDNIESLLALLDSRLIPSLLTERSSEQPGSLTPLARWILQAYGFDSYQSNSIETDGKTAVLRIILDLAQSSGQKHLEMLDGAGNTPIHNAVKGELPQALELMIDRRADLLHRESATGTTPFEMAVEKWFHKAAEGPPHIPPETPSWWCDEDAPYREVLEQQPEYFVEKKKAQDVQRVICELCRERAQAGGQKRKLVTLYEANEVAKRLAAKSHGDGEGKEVEVDEVRTWYERATHERERVCYR